MLDINVKNDFPILSHSVNSKALVYLDNAATSQKPYSVINAITDYYSTNNANVHRGIHYLSEKATESYESARKKIANFIGASASEVIFTSGTTESLNLVSQGLGLHKLKPGDSILLTDIEHHSNLVPWQEAAKLSGFSIDFARIEDTATPSEILDQISKMLVTRKYKLIAFTHASNVLGTIFPVKELCDLSRDLGIVTVVDGAQATPHLKINVKHLGCDFYAFSGHKMLGPTGIGVLYVNSESQEILYPNKFGGGMIDEVTLENSTFAKTIERFEGGTPNIAGAVGLGFAVDYLQSIGMETIRLHEIKITKYALDMLSKLNGIRIIGPQNPEHRTGLISFHFQGIHGHDIAAVLDEEGVAVRSGHHCTMPLHKKLSIPATVRASWYLYNTTEEIDILFEGINKALKILN